MVHHNALRHHNVLLSCYPHSCIRTSTTICWAGIDTCSALWRTSWRRSAGAGPGMRSLYPGARLPQCLIKYLSDGRKYVYDVTNHYVMHIQTWSSTRICIDCDLTGAKIWSWAKIDRDLHSFLRQTRRDETRQDERMQDGAHLCWCGHSSPSPPPPGQSILTPWLIYVICNLQ